MIHGNILRQCGGYLEHSVKSRNTTQSSSEDMISILEELTTRARNNSIKVNLKTRFDTAWINSVDKNTKENSNKMEYKFADVIRNCHIQQCATHTANKCQKRGKINEIDIEKGPDV
ncbi:hypothetical protein O181_037120 [Austropuccinia psidii MF-1]|uniref:Uncharacterized protein n=1 Tax=Austropuccinia psidii MF-1 TaxID=1389203 RepID=A0A9Q3DA95_9BASI|nr:hypothetical protein [Austropuccinia psidii MF-1]